MTRLARSSEVHVYSKILTKRWYLGSPLGPRDVSILYGPGQSLPWGSSHDVRRAHHVNVRLRIPTRRVPGV